MLYSLLHQCSHRLAILLALLALSLSLAAHSETIWFASANTLSLENPDPARNFISGLDLYNGNHYYAGAEAVHKLAETLPKVWGNIDVDHASKLELYSSLLSGHLVKLNNGVEYGVHFSGRSASLRVKYDF
jgi:hypothetical protein